MAGYLFKNKCILGTNIAQSNQPVLSTGDIQTRVSNTLVKRFNVKDLWHKVIITLVYKKKYLFNGLFY